MMEQPSAELGRVSDVGRLAVSKHVERHGGESPYRLCHESRKDARQAVLAGTRANTQRASLTLLVGRVVMVAMTRTANRQQGRQNAKEAKARRWGPEPNGYRTQKTAHSTQSSASREGMAVFKGQAVQSLRPPRATGSSGSPTVSSCAHGKLVKSIVCARAAALDPLISGRDGHGREWESSPRRPWRQRGRPATLPGTGREGRSRQPTEPTDTAAVK
jgi:hypothetical protein